MHSERAMATRCCWPPESWPGYLFACSGIFTRRQVLHRDLLGLLLRHLLHPDRRERAVLQDGEVREEVEVLEHHADLAADLVDPLEVVGELDAVDDDAALLVLLQPVDAADHGRLAGARRAADDDALAARDVQVDVAQHVELAVPLVHADHLRRRLRPSGRCGGAELWGDSGVRHGWSPFWPAASRRSIAEGVARHAEAEDEVEQGREGVAGDS